MGLLDKPLIADEVREIRLKALRKKEFKSKRWVKSKKEKAPRKTKRRRSKILYKELSELDRFVRSI